MGRYIKMVGPWTVVCAATVIAAVAAPALAQDVSYLDSEGNTITLAAPAERIAAIASSTPIVIAVDGGIDRLVSQGSATAFDNFLGEIFPEGADLPVLAANPSTPPNAEAVAALNPDLVLAWERLDVGPIVATGLPVGLWAYETDEEREHVISMIAALIGKPERADLILDWWDGIEARMDAFIATIPEEDRTRVATLWLSGGSLAVSGGDENSNLGGYAYWAGGVNVAEDWTDTTNVNAEQVAAWDPEVIFLFPIGGEIPDIYADPVLSLTQAARDGRVYHLPRGGQQWQGAGIEDPLTWLYMAELLYPDRLDPTLREEMSAAYQMLYGIEITDEQIDTILLMDLNQDAANYDRFAAR